MIVLWILLALAILLLAVTLAMFRFAFLRRPIPDPLTQEGREKGNWVQYEKGILKGANWMKNQEVKPLQVISYDGKKLYGRFVPCENARGTVLFFHGYRSHYAVDFSASMEFYHDLGYNMLFVDQRSHGLSEGRCITFGVKESTDVLSWVTYLAMMLGEEHPMFLSGLSMGATTVLMAADMEFPANVRGILADCGFTSPRDILAVLAEKLYHIPGKAAVAFLEPFARLFMGISLSQWSTEEALAKARYPVLLIHGTGDTLVPSFMSEQSYAACTGEKRLELFDGAGHGVSYLKDKDRYQKFLIEFLEKHNPHPSEDSSARKEHHDS